MAKLRDIIKLLIAEVVKAQTPGALPEKIDGIVSGCISDGKGGSLIMTQPMEEFMSQIASVLKQDNPIRGRSHTDEEWTWLVRSAFGPPLASIDLTSDTDENAETVLKAVRETLAQNTVGEVREYGFGCTLFSNPDMSPFTIGPVRLEPQLEWLERKVTEGAIIPAIARRVQKQWRSESIRKKKNVIDKVRESDILDAVGNCSYVCSVATNGLASDAGELKAQTAARLALTGIALWWEIPSNALDGLNLLIDRTVRHKRSLFFVPGKGTFAGVCVQGRPHAPPVAPERWADILLQNKNVFDVVGELIEFYLSPTGKVARPRLMNVLAQALLWFHEGCREQVDLMAIVKFASALDVLASGKDYDGIMELIKARAGLAQNDTIRTNGQTVKQAVKEIYRDGRSRTLHGMDENFGHDWTATRYFSEALARLCLISCLEWASSTTSDDPKLLKC